MSFEKFPSPEQQKEAIEGEKATLEDVEFVIEKKIDSTLKNLELTKSERMRKHFTDEIDFYNQAFSEIDTKARPWLEENPEKNFDDFLNQEYERKIDLLQEAQNDKKSDIILKQRQKDFELAEKMLNKLNLNEVDSKKEIFKKQFSEEKKEQQENEKEESPQPNYLKPQEFKERFDKSMDYRDISDKDIEDFRDHILGSIELRKKDLDDYRAKSGKDVRFVGNLHGVISADAVMAQLIAAKMGDKFPIEKIFSMDTRDFLKKYCNYELEDEEWSSYFN